MTRRLFKQRTIFWALDGLPTTVPVAVTASLVGSGSESRPLLDLAAGQVRRGGDGCQVVLRIGAVDHRVWSREPPSRGAH